ncbi:MAG TPA: FAD-dependent oxidoreductase [Opitutaceae bacterium]|nr:FAD-dependent oxidoreductase [Opitutaceae bacterium]
MNTPFRRRELSADLLVAGGGLAGVSAAVAAARNGARVVLVQDRSVLGGNASSEVRMHAVGADAHGNKPGLRESGLIEELRLDDAVRNPHGSFSQWDLLLYEKVALEPNITLLLDTAVIGVEMDGGVIRAARALSHLTEEEFVITARYFADCTGDGRIGDVAGADCRIGREARSEYGETLAPEQADRFTLGSSILFTGRRYDSPQRFIAPNWVRRFSDADFQHRGIHSFEYGYWWFEWGGHLDTIADNNRIRHELLRIALGVWDYVKNSGRHPDSANWALEWVGAIPAKRESRRFLGPHVLTEQDVLGGRMFPDAVAYGGWPIDLHPPAGVDAVDEPPCVQTRFDHAYTLPLRCYYSRNIPNLFFAGRNISATHVAFASTRVMATCSLGGQAVGTAAALLARANAPADIAAAATPAFLARLQQVLLRDDAWIPGVSNQDEADLARRARVTADSEQPGAPAANVIDGCTRDLRAKFGPWSADAIHRWESKTLPARLTLELPRPAAIREIHVTFDSGLQRELMLTPSDFFIRRQIRGPQPELVSSYRLSIDGRPVVEVDDNHQRKRVHRLPAPVTGAKVELTILATHGVPTARVFEVRIY